MKTIIRLWWLGETEAARHYCKCRPEHRTEKDCIWIPKSIIEHTTKRGFEHEVTLPDWYIEKKGL